MARPPRVHYEGAIYHVIVRAVDGRQIFDATSVARLLADFQFVKMALPYSVLAYCVMGNHFHFLIRVMDIRLDQIMQRVLTRFAIWHNKTTGHVGHVFQRRHEAILCTNDAYLRTLLRYIHNNPVKDGFCKTADEWPWSSHRVYAYGIEDPFVDPEIPLKALHPDPVMARRIYRRLISKTADLGEPPRPQTDECIPPTTRKASPRPKRDSLTAMAAEFAKAARMPVESLFGPDRGPQASRIRADLVRSAIQAGLRPTDIARYLNRSCAWVSKVSRGA